MEPEPQELENLIWNKEHAGLKYSGAGDFKCFKGAEQNAEGICENVLGSTFSFRNSQQSLNSFKSNESREQPFLSKLKEQWKTLVDATKNKEPKTKDIVNKLPNISNRLKNLIYAPTPLEEECKKLAQERDNALSQLRKRNVEMMEPYQKIGYLEIPTSCREKSFKATEVASANIDVTGEDASSTEDEDYVNISLLESENDYLRKKNAELNKALLTLGLERGQAVLKQSSDTSATETIINCNCSKIAAAFRKEKNDNAKLQAYIENILLKIVKFNPQILEINSYE